MNPVQIHRIVFAVGLPEPHKYNHSAESLPPSYKRVIPVAECIILRVCIKLTRYSGACCFCGSPIRAQRIQRNERATPTQGKTFSNNDIDV